ncbi:MAG: major facilitator superfamily 1 [Verrucomicrobiales bacterium]|nr:major facilitator superfamily 1 [Verrucomicrobiales bacterium]
MSKDLSISEEAYGIAAGIFFIGYSLLEIPGSLLVERWSARLWISRIMLTWGVIAVAMGFIQNTHQFYGSRFLLGMAEAGFFPGLLVYLSHWFRAADRAKAIALFMAAVPLSNMFAGPLSGKLLGVHWLGLAGWRWIFICEGFPAIILGFLVLKYLTDRPSKATWLEPEERDWITRELEKDTRHLAGKHHYSEAFKNPQVLLLVIIYFFGVCSFYGLGLWLPSMVKKLSGYNNFQVTVLASLPYWAALASMLLLGWSSDRTQERRWHCSISLIIGAIGLMGSVWLQDKVIPAMALFCLAGFGIYGYLPCFWALPSRYVTGAAAATAVGLINSFGNLGGFVGPSVVGYLKDKSHNFETGLAFLAGTALIAGLLILLLPSSRSVQAKSILKN